jgi:hypothetical protein
VLQAHEKRFGQADTMFPDERSTKITGESKGDLRAFQRFSMRSNE